MYFNLALKNIKKGYKDYSIYFLTLAVSVFLFYTFNSLNSQQSSLSLNTSQRSLLSELIVILGVFSAFAIVVFAFLILYANNYLIKRRKKELAVYSILGMRKKNISRILVYETLAVGLISLLAGLIAGFILSPVFSYLTASIFGVGYHFYFVFSLSATIVTAICFTAIYLIVMLCNVRSLKRQKDIDLLQADRQNELFKHKSTGKSVILFLSAVAMLGIVYYLAVENALYFIIYLLPLGLLACIGTFLFFRSVAGFLLKLAQSNKRFYYKRLNLFVVRQIDSKINTNYRSISMVCILLTISICMFSLGINSNMGIAQNEKVLMPYTFTCRLSGESKISKDVLKSFANSNMIQDDLTVQTFSSDRSEKDFAALLPPNDRDKLKNSDYPLEVISLTDFNAVRKSQNLREIKLNGTQAYIFSGTSYYNDLLKKIPVQENQLILFGNTFKITNHDFSLQELGTDVRGNGGIVLVIPDSYIPASAKISQTIYNADLQDAKLSDDFKDSFTGKLRQYCETNGITVPQSKEIVTKSYAAQKSRSNSAVFTFIGLYLGIVFIVTDTAILALQLLSEAADSRKRYEILRKIGVRRNLINHSIISQNLVYFTLPLILAIVHSIFGILVINTLMGQMGSGDITKASLVTTALIVLIYGAYFLITYKGCKLALLPKEQVQG